jgi:hypothetical protein
MSKWEIPRDTEQSSEKKQKKCISTLLRCFEGWKNRCFGDHFGDHVGKISSASVNVRSFQSTSALLYPPSWRYWAEIHG